MFAEEIEVCVIYHEGLEHMQLVPALSSRLEWLLTFIQAVLCSNVGKGIAMCTEMSAVASLCVLKYPQLHRYVY
jgi:hypothetical protein